MDYKKIVKMYIDGNLSMEYLNDKIEAFVEKVKMINPQLVEEFLTDLIMCREIPFNESLAKYAVEKMVNKDGTTGEHWSYEDAMTVLQGRGWNINPADWYYVLNMKYSDCYEQGLEDEYYIKEAYKFFDDPDGKPDKAKRYFLAMH